VAVEAAVTSSAFLRRARGYTRSPPRARNRVPRARQRRAERPRDPAAARPILVLIARCVALHAWDRRCVCSEHTEYVDAPRTRDIRAAASLERLRVLGSREIYTARRGATPIGGNRARGGRRTRVRARV